MPPASSLLSALLHGQGMQILLPLIVWQV